jgi:hypothetical protein
MDTASSVIFFTVLFHQILYLATRQGIEILDVLRMDDYGLIADLAGGRATGADIFVDLRTASGVEGEQFCKGVGWLLYQWFLLLVADGWSWQQSYG